ncbi:MAG TPA: hypothetical protein P5556_05640 [Candidatus Gastranaerophilales bacterium]|nr:hypothetical protein [Candidatus Gastranaerophilales bacterium]
MYSALTKEEVMQWRRSTEKITLEEFAQRLGKSLNVKKETNDLHDLLLRKKDEPEEIVKPKLVKKEIKETIEEKIEEKPEKQSKPDKPDFEITLSFSKKLNKREEVVLNYFCKNRKQKVYVNDLAKVLNLPNDYVYKYIKNLRNKLANNILENADKGGYILNI